MNSFRIIEPSSQDEFNKYYQLRFEVLVKPWGRQESVVKDAMEDRSLHVLVLDEENNAIATGRMQFNSDEEGQVRSMAVRADLRGKGLGATVLKYLEQKAKEKNLKQIILDSRDTAVGFYEKNGYKVTGNSLVLFDSIPHSRMIKYLDR